MLFPARFIATLSKLWPRRWALVGFLPVGIFPVVLALTQAKGILPEQKPGIALSML